MRHNKGIFPFDEGKFFYPPKKHGKSKELQFKWKLSHLLSSKWTSVIIHNYKLVTFKIKGLVRVWMFISSTCSMKLTNLSNS